MTRSLPLRPSLEWLKKTAKDELQRLRAVKPGAVLAEAQLALAREYGFDCWRKLKWHVEQQERTLATSAPPAEPALTRDQMVRRFLELVGRGRLDEVRQVLAAAPAMFNAVGRIRSGSPATDLAARDDEHDGTPLGWAEVAIDVTNNPKCRDVVEYLSALGTT